LLHHFFKKANQIYNYESLKSTFETVIVFVKSSHKKYAVNMDILSAALSSFAENRTIF